MSKIHLDVLTKPEQDVFAQLLSFRKDGYLAGGTALALQIQHRRSYDFDIFVAKPVGAIFRKRVKQIFGKVDFYVDTSEQISFRTKENIAVTFVTYYYQTLFPQTRTESVNLANVADIACDKAHTVGRRAIWRDYVDLFILLKRGIVTIEYLCEMAEKKFGGAFNEALFLEQLCYFKDVAQTPTEFLKESYTPLQIQKFLEKEVRAYLASILP